MKKAIKKIAAVISAAAILFACSTTTGTKTNNESVKVSAACYHQPKNYWEINGIYDNYQHLKCRYCNTTLVSIVRYL